MTPDGPAEWLTAVGTVGAVLVALGLAFRDVRRTRKLDADRDAEKQGRREAVERGQAETVAAWMQRDTIEFQNGSKLPVYQIRIWLHMRNEKPLYGKWRRIIAPSNDRPEQMNPAPEALIAVRDWRTRRKKSKQSAPAIMVEMTFRDASGRWWRRTSEGLLERTLESDAGRPISPSPPLSESC